MFECVSVKQVHLYSVGYSKCTSIQKSSGERPSGSSYMKLYQTIPSNASLWCKEQSHSTPLDAVKSVCLLVYHSFVNLIKRPPSVKSHTRLWHLSVLCNLLKLVPRPASTDTKLSHYTGWDRAIHRRTRKSVRSFVLCFFLCFILFSVVSFLRLGS